MRPEAGSHLLGRAEGPGLLSQMRRDDVVRRCFQDSAPHPSWQPDLGRGWVVAEDGLGLALALALALEVELPGLSGGCHALEWNE